MSNTLIADRHKALLAKVNLTWAEWAELAEYNRIETFAATAAYEACLRLMPEIPENAHARMRITALINQMGV